MKSPTRYAALLRGVNLGRAKKIAMADLRELMENVGFTDVRTVLNSGNIVLTTTPQPTTTIAEQIEQAIASTLSLSTKATVLSAAEFSEIARENPLLEHADHPSRLHVAFLRDLAAAKRLEAVAAEDWAPDVLAIGRRAAYMWLPNGLSTSRLPLAVDKLLRDDVTVRTWGTVSKLVTLLEPPGR